jgi:hypothetical protein
MSRRSLRPGPRLSDLAELVRLPAALTVPGDVLAGWCAAGRPRGRAALALPVASTCLYWAGMALNDYADRDVDRVERPERPIPSGRVTPRQALTLASGLTAGGLAAAAAAGGTRTLRVAFPLAGVVWAYDLRLKTGPLGPVAMAAARALDVLMGAAGDLRRASLPAAALAAHTGAVTALSRGEVHGSSSTVAAAVTGSTAAVALAVAVLPGGTPTSSRTGCSALAGVYAATVGTAQASAVANPDASTVRRATGAGIRGMIPLRAALAARAGALRPALLLLATGPVARLASRVVSPT